MEWVDLENVIVGTVPTMEHLAGTQVTKSIHLKGECFQLRRS
jgi:hypothetical protein